jgi:hypothetical protein
MNIKTTLIKEKLSKNFVRLIQPLVSLRSKLILKNEWILTSIKEDLRMKDSR